MEIFLETDRLVLRRFTEDDVDKLVDLDIHGAEPPCRSPVHVAGQR
jgi:hypothetical protein